MLSTSEQAVTRKASEPRKRDKFIDEDLKPWHRPSCSLYLVGTHSTEKSKAIRGQNEECSGHERAFRGSRHAVKASLPTS